MKKILLGIILPVSILICLAWYTLSVPASSGNASFANGKLKVSVKEEPVGTAPPQPAPRPTVAPDREITLMAVGDNLIHMGVVNTGRQTDGSYDFSFLFKGIEDFLAASDIKIINQETILGGNQRGFSGFPYFNSPTEIGDAIADAGFNVVLHASNHSADQGLDGLLSCLSFWETHPGVLVTGIHADVREEPEIPLITADDITFAILNYTYSPNSETIPSSILGHLDMLCDYDERGRLDFTTLNPQVIEDIARARTLADVVIVCPHWGTEYTTVPSRYQEEFALQMTEAGADLIIGTHPHVVQPVEWLEAENGNRSLCFYSLGNYVSTQKNALSMLEALCFVTFRVSPEGISIVPEASGALPLICQYTSSPLRIENIYLLEEYTAEQADAHGIRSYGGVRLSLEDLQTWSREILGPFLLKKGQILNQ